MDIHYYLFVHRKILIQLILVKMGANVNQKTILGNTPICYSTYI